MSICSVPDVAVRADVESPCSVTFAATPACRVKAPLSAIDAPGPFWQEVTLARAVAGSTESPCPVLQPESCAAVVTWTGSEKAWLTSGVAAAVAASSRGSLPRSSHAASDIVPHTARAQIVTRCMLNLLLGLYSGGGRRQMTCPLRGPWHDGGLVERRNKLHSRDAARRTTRAAGRRHSADVAGERRTCGRARRDGCYARRPNAAARAFNARARARASVLGAGRPVRTSNARQSASDHATAASAPQRGQRIAGAGPSRRARAQQLGHTPYLRPAPAPASGPGTTVQVGGRSGSTCTKARGMWSKRWLTSTMASTGVSSTTRYQAPWRSGQS